VNFLFELLNRKRITFSFDITTIESISELFKSTSKSSQKREKGKSPKSYPFFGLLLAKHVDELENHGIGLLLKEVVVCVGGRCLIVIIIMFEAFPSMKTQFAEM